MNFHTVSGSELPLRGRPDRGSRTTTNCTGVGRHGHTLLVVKILIKVCKLKVLTPRRDSVEFPAVHEIFSQPWWKLGEESCRGDFVETTTVARGEISQGQLRNENHLYTHTHTSIFTTFVMLLVQRRLRPCGPCLLCRRVPLCITCM